MNKSEVLTDQRKIERALVKARRKAARQQKTKIIREELPHTLVFAWILVAGVALAPITLGIGTLLALAVGAFYMAGKTWNADKLLPKYERATARMYVLADEYRDIPALRTYADKLGATTLKVQARAGAR